MSSGMTMACTKSVMYWKFLVSQLGGVLGIRCFSWAGVSKGAIVIFLLVYWTAGFKQMNI